MDHNKKALFKNVRATGGVGGADGTAQIRHSADPELDPQCLVFWWYLPFWVIHGLVSERHLLRRRGANSRCGYVS